MTFSNSHVTVWNIPWSLFVDTRTCSFVRFDLIAKFHVPPAVQRNDDYVLKGLRDIGLVSRKQIDATRERLNGRENVLDVLIKDGVVGESDVSRSLAAQAHMDWIDLSAMIIPPEIIKQIRAEEARRFKVIPVAFGETGLVVAVSDPLDIDTIDSLSFLLQRELELVCSSPEKIREALIKYYGTADEAAEVIREKIGEDVDLGLEIGNGEAITEVDEADAPIIRLVSMLIIEAHRTGASDIHLEPLDKKFRVRFRIDGVLQEMQSPSKRLQSAIVSRLKIMTGSMSIAEKRLPQDGRIQVKIKKKSLDLRVSTIPTNHGESVVMRLLDKSSLMFGLPELGFFHDDQETFERLIQLPDGILLVTGPTGSGKTSTLYACLNDVNKPDRKIITVEEPIEYQMTGINQVQVNSEIGMTFPAASALNSAPGSEHHHDWRDSRPGNRQYRHQRVTHRPSGFQHPAHERRAVRGRPFDRYRRPAISCCFFVASSYGSTTRQANLPALQTTGGTERKRNARAANRARTTARRADDAWQRMRTMSRHWLQRPHGHLRNLCSG